MCDRKSETSQMVQSMVHGKPSRKGCNTTSIYDIFDWQLPDQNKGQNIKDSREQNVLQNKSCISQQVHQPQHHSKQVVREKKVYINQVLTQDPEQQYAITKNKHLKPHLIKNQLYEMEEVHLKRAHSQQANIDQIFHQAKPIAEKKKLNQNLESDKRIIESRKKKIKEFKQYTRDLPNSAFTTYYGRPAFQAYGRCNSSSQLKTHNVMPHRGENNPRTKQTYAGALINGKKIKIQDHLPRKPIQQIRTNTTHHKNKQKIQNLPLQKPDLVNHVRFSEAKIQNNKKEAVPSHKEIMEIPKRKQVLKPKKNNKKAENFKILEQHNDGLKFMNNRDHLINLLEEKKMKDSRLAYKVTECYPQKTATQRQSQIEGEHMDAERPAGIAYERGEPAYNIIYRRN